MLKEGKGLAWPVRLRICSLRCGVERPGCVSIAQGFKKLKDLELCGVSGCYWGPEIQDIIYWRLNGPESHSLHTVIAKNHEP